MLRLLEKRAPDSEKRRDSVENLEIDGSDKREKREGKQRVKVPDRFWETRVSSESHAQLDFRICKDSCNPSDHERFNITIVTASSRDHFPSLYSVLVPSISFSVKNQSLPFNARVIIYDLALGGLERDLLYELEGKRISIVRQFPYHRFPAYFNVEKEHGKYAWKPVIIEQMLTEFQEPVVWIDSESRLQPASLEWGFQRMMENGGFFSQIPDHDPAGNWQDQAALSYLANRAGLGCQHVHWPGPVKWLDNHFELWTQEENETLWRAINEAKRRGDRLS